MPLGLSWLIFSVVFLLSFATTSTRAEELKLGGTGGALETMRELAGAYAREHSQTRIRVLPSLGSGGGIKAVLAGAIQIAVSSRPLKNAELTQGAVAVEYGRTPFIFVTSINNQMTGLDVEDLVEIYAGRTTTWSDGTRIRLVLRPLGESDSEMVKNISPVMREAKTQAEARHGMLFAVTDQESADYQETVPGALGTSTLAQILSEKRALKPLQLNGVDATPANIANGSYPLYKPLYLVTGPGSPPAALIFIDFVLSPQGLEILERNGHWVP